MKESAPPAAARLDIRQRVGEDLRPVQTVHENEWFSVLNRGGYYTVEYHLRHVVVLPIVNHDSIILIRVKRPVIGDDPLEIPAGSIEDGETAEEGAARELSEETGVLVRDLTRFIRMPSLCVSPNRSPGLMNVFRINLSGEEYEARKLHDDEVTDVNCVSIEAARGMLSTGALYACLPVAVIGMYLLARE